jgi:hypothetical protein
MIWLRRILQYVIGLILLATSIGKMLDVQGFITVLRTYESFPEVSLSIVALLFVITELKVAELLLFGKHLVWGAAASVAMHIFFTAGATLSMIRGLNIPNCGCFGVFLARPLTWGTVGEDLVMLTASILLFILLKKEQRHVSGAASLSVNHT